MNELKILLTVDVRYSSDSGYEYDIEPCPLLKLLLKDKDRSEVEMLLYDVLVEKERYPGPVRYLLD